MSAKSDALETAVTELIQARAALDGTPGPRARARLDHGFARLSALLAPRIRYFIRACGLTEFADDARQACAIATWRAAESYDPALARFTTHVNWQLRAELQALRLRLYGDQRRAGRRQAGTLLSLDALIEAGAGDDWLVDPGAQAATECAASDGLADRMADRLADDWAARRRTSLCRGRRAAGERVEARVAAERALVRHQLTVTEAAERLRESDRHIVRRAIADMARRAGETLH